MRKLQSVLCVTLLSTVLVGNVFAGDSLSSSVYSFFDNVINTAVSLFLRDDCPPRQCQNCRPTERDENGNCRPRED